ncbi:MAG: nicotinate-nucleotide adenylyltransferase [Bacteroidales bacterium]|nr:nicotinate-nucleotide adenylyltransferase [Bacteroidales bacterium]
MKTGLYFGSFNPIHNGHMAIANFMREFTDLDEVWFVVSPQNPFKNKQSLLADYHRLEMVDLAIDDTPGFRASNIEFHLPKPSYTVDTLAYLFDKYPEREFVLIMGSDNLVNFHKWKNFNEILRYHHIYVYPRPNTPKVHLLNHPNVHITDAPLMEISSSFIRKAIGKKKDIRFYLPTRVWNFIKEMHFYEK